MKVFVLDVYNFHIISLWFIADVDEEVGNIFERKGRNKRKGPDATSEPVKQSVIELTDSEPEEIVVETMYIIIYLTRFLGALQS